MPKFVLLLRDERKFPGDMSPEELQKVLERYGSWIRGIGGAGQKLTWGSGKVLKRANGRLAVTDGPFAESREVVGGFLVVEAPDYAAVVEQCQKSPHLDFGSIEIRQIDVM